MIVYDSFHEKKLFSLLFILFNHVFRCFQLFLCFIQKSTFNNIIQSQDNCADKYIYKQYYLVDSAKL